MSKQISKEYFDQAIQGLAKKEDLASFANKDDLAHFATKDDLKGLATKADTGHLEGRMGTLEGRMATKGDIHRLEVQTATKEDLDQFATQMHVSFSNLQSSVDRYLKRIEGWYQEFTVLKGKHEKLSGALVQKRVVSEKDTIL